MTLAPPVPVSGRESSLAVQPRRNRGLPLDLGWIREVQANRSAAERRAGTLAARRTVKKQWQAAWLLKAIACMDLTTLSGDDTPGEIHRLCAKARQPLRPDLAAALHVEDLRLTVRAVCVYPTMVPHAVKALAGANIPVASVAAGFPAGLSPLPMRLDEIKYAIEEGAHEIDVAISRHLALRGEWEALYDEICAFRRRGSPNTCSPFRELILW
jgi:deoxyribose-phosphate aldolase